ncbi:MAG: MBL fold metallo-hydrolase [Lentisphaerae bacterium]|nr:MBL fold metallo-hydrolase [Lentisphaerota bacterium]
MRVKVLGSAAAEAMPALWCECSTCKYALEHGGKDVRRRTCYLIDDDTLVDYGPDIFWQVTAFKVDLLAIRRIVVTHSHVDHFNPVDLLWRRPGFSVVSKTVKLLSNEAVIEKIRGTMQVESSIEGLAKIALESQTLEAGKPVFEGDLRILPLPANHAPNEKPLFYVFTRNNRSLLIANDTGFPSQEAWDLLAAEKLDAAILDCTGGAHPKHGKNRNGHMGADTNIEFRQQMLELGIIQEDTPVFANHFSHNALCTHEQLRKYLEPHGIQVAYDGLEIEI